MSIVADLAWRYTLRLALVLAISVGLGMPLGFVFAVQRTLDLDAYPGAPDRSMAVIELVPGDLDRVRADFGPDAFTAMPWTLPVRHGDRESAVTAMVTATPESEGFLTEETQIASVPVAGEAWIDISADLAYALGVEPGETVSAGLPVESAAELTVRSVHAARFDGYPWVAQMPLTQAQRFEPEENLQTILVAPFSPEDVDDRLKAPFYLERLQAGGYPDPEPAESFAHVHARQAELSLAGLELVLGTAILAAAAGLAILIREAWIFAQAMLPTLRLVADLGMSPRRLARQALLLGVVGAAVGVVVGALFGLLPYTFGVLGPGLPPTLGPVWAGAAVGLVALAAVVIVLTWRLVGRRA